MGMKMIYRLLLVFHGFVGIGAIAGGWAAIVNPLEPLGAPVDMLKNSPFENFFIPGLILFTVIGLGNILSALTILFKSKYQGYISSVFGWALVIWIVVQCIMIQGIHFLHILFFIIGLVQGGLAATILFKESLFPANILINYYKKTGKEAHEE
ncbi:hypothetical protein [Anaerosolibacter sp.]|uniref:hypothetical protein n=1 Tax=Anaerosolibacter sp. TaxID=1872527 RepID=UPI0039EE950F